MRRRRLGVAALTLLGACGVPPRQPAPLVPPAPTVTAPTVTAPTVTAPTVTAPTVTAPTVTAPTGPVYRIDPHRSEVRILVYRAGALARFGHNHVLIARDLAGQLRLAAPGVFTAGSFDTAFSVAALAVDESAARHEEGSEFATEPSASDIDGTRRNLLGPGVLDAAAFPTLRVHGTTAGTATALTAQVVLEVHGGATPLDVPLAVSADRATLSVRGGFSVRQSALGLAPFSAALGALSVRDEIQVRFRIVAVAGG